MTIRELIGYIRFRLWLRKLPKGGIVSKNFSFKNANPKEMVLTGDQIKKLMKIVNKNKELWKE